MDIFDQQIIGYDSVKTTIRQINDILKDPDKYRKHGADVPHGLLLVGSPGTGKSTLCRCLMKSCGRQTIIFRRDAAEKEFMEELQRAFQEATEKAPSVILLDDIHLYASSPYSSEWAGVQAAIDESGDKDVFVIATANSLGCVARSLLRPGRFDFIITMSDPKGKTAEKIIAHYLKGVELAKDVNILDVVKILDGQSCASLESALNIARINAIYDGASKIYRKHLIPALMQVVYQLRKSDKEFTPEEIKSLAMHEASHAAVCEILFPGHVASVSLLAKDDETNGMTSYYQRGFSTETDLMNLILVTLAGKAGVELYSGTMDMGADLDIQSGISLVRDWAAKLGGAGFSAVERPNDNISPDLMHANEVLVAAKLDELYGRAKSLLHDNWDFVDRICSELLKNETLLSSDILRIRESCKHPKRKYFEEIE